MRFPTNGTRLLDSLLSVTLLAGALLLSACSREGVQANDDEEFQQVTYRMGDPITDSTIASIVTSEYGEDTLTAEGFRQQIEMITRQVPQLQGDPDRARELRKNIIEDFILTHALFGEAEKENVEVDSSQLNQRMEQIRQRFPDEETFEQALQADNLTRDELRQNLHDMMLQETMLNRMAEDVEEPTEQETEEFSAAQSEQVRAQHILFLIPEGSSRDRRDSIRQEAETVLDSIKSGADFEEMAQQHSQDGTAQQGGDLGYFSRGQMVEPFSDAAFALRDSGDVTQDLVRTQYGYHIIRLTGRRSGEAMDTTQARQMIVQNRRREAMEEGVEELREKVEVRINPDIVDTELNTDE